VVQECIAFAASPTIQTSPPTHEESRHASHLPRLCGHFLFAASVTPLIAADVDLALACRAAYTTAEPIEFALLYSGGDAKSLPLELRHADGSTLSMDVPLEAGRKSQTRLVTVLPGMLKPGRYNAASRADKEKSITFAVHPFHHPNPY
jgi:hypothetical protein